MSRGRRGQQVRIVEQPAEHRAHAQPPQQRGPGAGRVQPRGDDRPARRLRRERAWVRVRVDRHPVLALQARRALGQLGVLARLEREHDHPDAPVQLFAVVPAQALAHGLGREGERTGGIGEQRDL